MDKLLTDYEEISAEGKQGTMDAFKRTKSMQQNSSSL